MKNRLRKVEKNGIKELSLDSRLESIFKITNLTERQVSQIRWDRLGFERTISCLPEDSSTTELIDPLTARLWPGGYCQYPLFCFVSNSSAS